jgi:hypothetical protein
MGDETPRNGVLAQCIEVFQKGTAKDASGLQKFLVATMVLVPLVLVLALSVGIMWLVLKVNLVTAWPWVSGAVAVCSGGIWISGRRARKKQAMLPAGTEPGQETIGNEAGAEGDNSTNEDRNDVSDGAS